jgi:hypothetical protein
MQLMRNKIINIAFFTDYGTDEKISVDLTIIIQNLCK